MNKVISKEKISDWLFVVITIALFLDDVTLPIFGGSSFSNIRVLLPAFCLPILLALKSEEFIYSTNKNIRFHTYNFPVLCILLISITHIFVYIIMYNFALINFPPDYSKFIFRTANYLMFYVPFLLVGNISYERFLSLVSFSINAILTIYLIFAFLEIFIQMTGSQYIVTYLFSYKEYIIVTSSGMIRFSYASQEPSAAACILTAITPMAIGNFFNNNKSPHKNLYLFFAVLSIFLFLLTQSSTIPIVLILALLYYTSLVIFKIQIKSNKYLATGIIAITLLFSTIIFCLWDELSGKFKGIIDIVSPEEINYSGATRILSVILAIIVIKNNILGIGFLSNIPYVLSAVDMLKATYGVPEVLFYEIYQQIYTFSREIAINNWILKIGVEIGIFGIISFLYLTYLAFKEVSKLNFNNKIRYNTNTVIACYAASFICIASSQTGINWIFLIFGIFFKLVSIHTNNLNKESQTI